MKKNCIIISAKGRETFSPLQQKQLDEILDVTFVENLDQMTEEKLVKVVKDAQILAITRRTTTNLNKNILSKLKNLKGIAIYATGYEWIDIEYCKKNDIKVKYLKDYSADTVAEHTLGMLMTISRRIHLSYDKSRNMIPNNISLRGFEIKNKTIGIWGYGIIGKKVAKLLQPFSKNISYYDLEKDYSDKIPFKSKEELIADSDIIILLANKTRGEAPLIGTLEINKMKNGIVIINSSRSALVDNEAVINAVKNQKIYGYAVDDNIEILNSKDIEYGRILQTYHTGWYSDEAINRGTDQWAANILLLDKEVTC